MLREKTKRVPDSYKGVVLNLPCLPSMIVCVLMLSLGLFFIAVNHGEIVQKIPKTFPLLYGLILACVLMFVASLAINGISFLHAAKCYRGKRTRFLSCFFYKGIFYEISSSDFFWDLRFGDLRFKRHYYFPKYCFYPEVSLIVAKDEQKINIVLEDVYAFFTFTALQIACFKNGFSDIEQIIKQEIEGAIFKAFEEVYRPVSGRIKSPDEDADKFAEFENKLNDLLYDKGFISNPSYSSLLLEISENAFVENPHDLEMQEEE